MAATDNWSEWREYVLHSLERIEESGKATSAEVQAIRAKDIAALKLEIALLKVKSGFWGAVGGAIPVAALLLLEYFRGS